MSGLLDFANKYMQLPQRVRHVRSATKIMQSLSDDQVIELMLRASNADAIRGLMNDGPIGYPTASDADMALCNHLAFYCAGDAAQMDRLFRQSMCMREKWDEVHSGDGQTYGEMTIQKAIDDCLEFYSGKANGGKRTTEKLRIVRMSEMMYNPPEYLFDPYVPKGKLTIVAGVSGGTKTWLTLYWASIISRGGRFTTDDPTLVREPGVVLYQTRENDYESDVLNRLNLMMANLDNIFMIDDRDVDGNGFPLSLSDGRIEAAMETYHPELVIFDPIQSFIGDKVDFHRANEIRPILDKLIDLAKIYNCVVILVAHLNKNSTASALDRILGSSDFRNAARSIIIVGSDPNAPDWPDTRVMVQAKNSLCKPGRSIRYHIDNMFGVAIDGLCDIDEDAIVTKPVEMQTRNKPAVTLTRAIELLDGLLGDTGYCTREAIDELQESEGISEGTLSKARNELGIKSFSIGQPPNRKTWWLSPDIDRDQFKIDHDPSTTIH